MRWYCTHTFCVRWGSTYSSSFHVSNGVRQGGILSPCLFNVYMDDLSEELNEMRVGCMFNGITYNHLMYADDMVLVAPSIRALQTLLTTCDEYACNHSIRYNTKKTVCMCIRPKCLKFCCNPTFVLSGNELKCVSSHKYLGVEITTGFKDDMSIRCQMRNLYSRGNMIIRNFRNCSDNVKGHLFQSFCTNLYCSTLWCYFNVETLRCLKVAFNRIFRILLNLKHRISMSQAFVTRNLNPFPVILRKSIVSFRSRILNSNNVLVYTIVNSMYFMFSDLTKHWNDLIFCM